MVQPHPTASLYRDDAVGLNFEHVFNGAEAQHDISMFTPRKDPCVVEHTGEHSYVIRWSADESSWGLDAQMQYDFSEPGQIDLEFECTPRSDLFSQGFVAMMWASYLHSACDREIRFWGRDGDRIGWIQFGEGEGADIEIGTVAHAMSEPLPFEKGAQTLNLVEHDSKKFITPFYYGLIDGDHDFSTTDDRLLYLTLFDQADAIRFAMWNFFRDETGNPDTHSPAWDWQYVIRHPEIGQTYRYRARIIVKPFRGESQVWEEYRRWMQVCGSNLPSPPVTAEAAK